MLGKDDRSTGSRAIRAAIAFANAVEPITGRDNPCIGRPALQVLAEVFEDRGMLGGNGGKVIEGFIDAGCEAGRGNVVAEYSLIGNVGEEARLRNELVEQVGN